jgi:hypothetical protein
MIDMWHLKTKQGTFWIMSGADDTLGKYFFGVDNIDLGVYNDVGRVISDVREQLTGHIKWDCLLRVSAPARLDDWISGIPEDWK